MDATSKQALVQLLKRRFPSGVILISIFTALYLIASATAMLANGNAEFIFYLVVMLFLAALLLSVHLRLGLSTPLLLALSIWGGIHMAGGLVPVPESWPINGEIRVLYSWWIIPNESGGGYLKFDHIAHAYGFGVATWLTWEILSLILRRRYVIVLRPTLGVLILCFAAGCGFGALNEVVEFIATRIATTNVGGYENTGWDLVANAVGALIAVCIIRLANRHQPTR